jgi:long-chain-fatty-acid--CoA ligase ACSBG
MQKLEFPTLPKNEYLYMSAEGLSHMGSLYEPKNPLKHILWTTDITVELPIKMKKEGAGSDQPRTLIELFETSTKQNADELALMSKKNGKWVGRTFKEYHTDVIRFAKALLSVKIPCFKSVNIIGFNSPEWCIAYFGALFANTVPVGIYTTNNPEACQYVSHHSEAYVVVAENNEQLQKYLKVWDQLPELKYVLLYNDKVPDNVPADKKTNIMTFDNFLKLGDIYKQSEAEPEFSLDWRKNKVKPGHCATLVYTSGTTGPPKAVMLSHDNLSWTSETMLVDYRNPPGSPIDRIVSFLPLSHVAAQMLDVIGPLVGPCTAYFTDPSALQGSLINYLKEVRPTFFFSVPRVWEKIEEQMKLIAANNGFLKKTIANWAKSIGKEGTLAEHAGQPTPFGWGIAKTVVFNNIKKALGLENARFVMYGAAPLQLSTREYFLTLNFLLINAYGMSECSGPQNFDIKKDPEAFNLKSTGCKLNGTEIKIFNPDKGGDGEISYRGRNVMMGYFKDEQSTKNTIDDHGFLHSGDLGHVDKHGNLCITGRLKELLITGGGENIAPVLIENEIKSHLPFLSNIVVVGDQKKFLAALLTLKNDVVESGIPLETLSKESLDALKPYGIEGIKTVKDLENNEKFKKVVDEGIAQANAKAISRAHFVRKWVLLPKDLSIPTEELTPTLKVKRNVVHKKYHEAIEKMYLEAKL